VTEPDDADMARMAAEYTAAVRPVITHSRVDNVSGTSVAAVRQACIDYGIDPAHIVDDSGHHHYGGDRADRISCAEAHCGTQSS
jgi:hypothetical protein